MHTTFLTDNCSIWCYPKLGKKDVANSDEINFLIVWEN